jgi:hypothetical protein
VARTNPVLLIDLLRRDEYYRRSNLPHREYTKDVLDQWLKHHMEFVEAERDTDETYRCIWIDITDGIERLPDTAELPLRTVVRAYAVGFREAALVEATGQPEAGRLVQIGIQRLSNLLMGRADD